MDKCEELKEQVKKFLAGGVKVRPIKDDGCLLQIPFHDPDGDPIRVAVYKTGDSIILHDAGVEVVVSHMQHAET